MAERGPVPNRSDQRRRRNAPADGVELRGGTRAVGFDPPAPLKSWHPAAIRWFESLGQSGQAEYYEPSDWATAFLLAETMSRELRPRVVGVTKDGDVVKASVPPTGAAITAFLRGCAVLGVTEGDRLRLRIELERAADEGDEDGGTVTWLDRARSGSGGAS